MSKNGSGRSSATASIHVNSPHFKDESPELEPQQSNEGASASAQVSMADVDLSESTNLSVAAPPATESQPMTASNSTSSNPSTKDASSNGASSFIPYGTRSSRNRTGTSRPNYAEDKELDAEFEVPPVKENTGRKARTAADHGNNDTLRQTANTRKVAGPEEDLTLTVQSHHKEAIPGTLTFSANPAPVAISRKRKAANLTSTIQAQLQVPAQNTHPSQAGIRRASMVTHTLSGFQDSNMLSFDNCGARLNGGRLVADDGTVLEVNDHAYLVCEPPGEPYYLGRIMEFLHVQNDPSQPIDALRLNWYYRPKDIGRKVNDTRQVFASMHSDISPLTALRGKCEIKHKSEVEELDELRKTKDSFWYEKLYDRYIHRYYDVIPTSQVINVPVEVKKVLDERWKYIIVEPGRGKELTSAVKTCKRCSRYCASNDSVDCAVCQNTYHMSCVSPPLLKKPSRGFAWACGPCSKAQEKKLEARNTPNITDSSHDGEEEEFPDEDDLSGAVGEPVDTNRTTPTISSEAEVSFHPGTAEQIHQASLWQFRYLGIHCKVEDALDYDDRIYPRASSRLGPRHQANVPDWPGRPVEYVKPLEVKRKYLKGGGHKKDTKLSKESLAAIEADKLAREKRPKWIMDEPQGYVHRGEDYDNDDPRCTSKLLYRFPEDADTPEKQDLAQRTTNRYMAEAASMGMGLGLPIRSTNILDVALNLFFLNNYDTNKALEALSTIDKKAFKEPELTAAEQKKFEDGVTKFGSEWHSIKKHVKTVSAADIVRYYYTWKKSDRGKHVWGNYSGRKNKKEAKRAEVNPGKLQDDVADEHDDSAFDNEKARQKNRGFQCKFCSVRQSRQWRRAPNTAAGTMIPENPNAKTSGKDKGNQLMVALCRRCAELWRRYAIQWEDIDEMAKKVAQAGGRAWKRKIDEELLKELQAANEITNQFVSSAPTAPPSANGTPAPAVPATSQINEPPKKKLKGNSDRDSIDPGPDGSNAVVSIQKKKPVVEKPPPPPPPPPEPPKAKILPCAICEQMEPMGDQHLSCRDCRLTVHRNCYGVVGDRSPSKWVCDMCSNDKNPQVSIQYKCMLCPVEYTEHDFVEPPKASHKKKSEKDREKDRLEREQAQKVADYFKKKQEEMNKPVNPREPLKRTANNNWIHVTCAVFTPEAKFGNAQALEPSEGIPSIPFSRYEETCNLCNKNRRGPCVSCHTCKTPVHVGCAHQGGWTLGFDIVPVKGSRREQFNIVNINGEIGTMTAAIWCKDHVPTKTIFHQMYEIVDAETGLNALQLYVRNFKQADLTLTGTVRKATLVNQSTKAANTVSAVQNQNANRRTSTATVVNGSTGRGSVSHGKVEDPGSPESKVEAEKVCITCQVDVSPRWWPFHPEQPEKPDIAVLISGDQNHGGDSPLINGLGTQGASQESGEGPAALAAAALHQEPAKSPPVPTEFQCHQCHWRGIRKEPTPPPDPSPRESPLQPVGLPVSSVNPPTEPQPTRGLATQFWPVPPSGTPGVEPRGPTPQFWTAPPPGTPGVEPRGPAPQFWTAPNSGTPGVSGVENRGLPPHLWPVPPSSYPPSSSSNSWPHRSPAPQTVENTNQLNGNRSPHMSSAGSAAPNMHRQSSHGLPHSPRQNGHLNQIPNGYPRPPSPRQAMRSPAMHMNGSYPSYTATRLPPHHLTNGGPPPRATETSVMQNHTPQMHRRPSYGPLQGSPPVHHNPHPASRDASHSQNNSARPNENRDNRVNGGASASPSLRNLLS